MKKLLLLCAICCYALTAAAQSTVHTVQRGETLASIAKQYHLSIDELKAANPYIGKKLYVGIKLQIPEVKEAPRVEEVAAATPVKEKKQKAQAKQEQERNVVEKPVKEEKAKIPATTEKETAYNKWAVSFDITYYFAEGTSSKNFGNGVRSYNSSFGMGFDLAANYYFAKSAFIAPGIGVLHSSSTGYNSSGYGNSNKHSNSSTAVRIPIMVGYDLAFSEKIGLTLQTGPHLGYIVAGYHEENGDKIKFKDMEDTEPFHVNWSVGAFIYWGETRLGAEYLIGLKEGSEGTFGVSLGWRMDW